MRTLTEKDITTLKLTGKKVQATEHKPLRPIIKKESSSDKLAQYASESIKISREIVERNARMTEIIVGVLSDIHKQKPTEIASKPVNDKPREWVFKITRDMMGQLDTIRATEI